MPRHSTRSTQFVSAGIGKHYSTPKKSRRSARHNELYQPLNKRRQIQQLQADLDACMEEADWSDEDHRTTDLGRDVSTVAATATADGTATVLNRHPNDEGIPDRFQDTVPHDDDYGAPGTNDAEPFVEHTHSISEWVAAQTKYRRPRRRDPSDEAKRHYDNWRQLIPRLVHPLLEYEERTAGRPATAERDVVWKPPICKNAPCEQVTNVVTCLYWDHFSTVDVTTCRCLPLPEYLVAQGFFPTSPTEPRVCVSIELLEFYDTLFQRSGDAVTALASALALFYHHRGWKMVNSKGQIVKEPFRKGLGHAIQWYDTLRGQVDRTVEDVISQCSGFVFDYQDGLSLSQNQTTDSDPPQRCARTLQLRCPACFGGNCLGREIDSARGGDIHVCLDGNFHQRHRASAGDSPWFYDPLYFIPKEQVDGVGRRIDAVRKSAPRVRSTNGVSEEAIEVCRKSHEAADGERVKANAEVFDDTGIMALVCRHDTPLFFANIDTPGEQQKYAIALLEHLFSLLPPNATVCGLYNVGCVLKISLEKYDILPESITSRLRLATPAMHAYAHEWDCQIFFNARFQTGMGLSDGEGTERLWSRLRGLINLTRGSARTRRIWLLDRKAASINWEYRNGLGTWHKRKLRVGVEGQADVAKKDIDTCGYGEDVLRAQWENQKMAQTSVRSHAPNQLRRDLDTVIDLQSSIENIHRVIQHMRTSLGRRRTRDTEDVLCGLEEQQADLFSKCDDLYLLLNITEDFPHLEGMSLRFMQTLLLARDLKINIRKRAVASFLEWEKLDQAGKGRQAALGTKAHQRTRQAITRRKPALLAAIRKFNKYCSYLAESKDPSWNIVIPLQLPTDLVSLKDCQELHQDVWTSRLDDISQPPPLWLADPAVRKGIRGILKLDRCAEEQRRIAFESDHLCEWFGEELCAIELALLNARGTILERRLKTIQTEHLLYAQRWATPWVPQQRYNRHIGTASVVANLLHTAAASEIINTPNIPTTNLQEREIEEVDPGHRIAFTLDEDEDDEEIQRPGSEDGKAWNDPTSVGQEKEESDGFDSDVGENILDALDFGENIGTCDESVPSLIFRWDLQETSSSFENLYDVLSTESTTNWRWQHSSRPPRPHGCSIILSSQRSTSVTFYPSDIDLLKPRQLLNDVCINELLRLFQKDFNTHAKHAIFSTYVLTYSMETEDRLHSRIKHTLYTDKERWVFPIHRAHPSQHWTIAIADISSKEIFHFDSLSMREHREEDIQKVFKFIGRAMCAAGMVHCGVWTARSMLRSNFPLQRNGYDCGVWIIAAAVAAMRGHKSLLFDDVENDIVSFRRYLLHRVLSLPEI